VELADDPTYQRTRAALDAASIERAETLRRSELPIVADLRAHGVLVDSVWDLVNTSEPYPAALPILVRHLERGGYPDRVMESLGRALAVAPTVAYWDVLKALYASSRNPGHKEGIAVALAASATRAQLDDLISFVHDADQGPTRTHFVRTILRVGGAPGREVVATLRSDPVVGKEAEELLRRR
jgi:hypothetical protein